MIRTEAAAFTLTMVFTVVSVGLFLLLRTMIRKMH